MKKLFLFPAYTWAFICVFLMPITFIGNDYFAHKIIRLPFMKINPVYSGGDTVRSYKQDSIIITINKPVFESLIGKSPRGFVQVKFSGVKHLPAFICSTIDYDNDGKPDFSLNINTLNNDTKLKVFSKYVLELGVSSQVKDYWIVRIKVLNPDKY
jgi:hypothetical protein